MDKRNLPHSLEHREKISKALKGRHLHSPTQFKKGHKHTLETLLKIGQSLKGHIPWNKGTKGVMKSWAKGKTFSAEYRKKLSDAHKGDNPCQAKSPSYYSTHGWISRQKVRPDVCSHCKDKKTYTLHWANLDHKYRLDINDWIALCASCHRIYDMKNNLR